MHVGIFLACIASGIVGTRNNFLDSRAARRMGRRTLKYRLHENHGFLNSPHTSVWEKWIGQDKYTCQSNVK